MIIGAAVVLVVMVLLPNGLLGGLIGMIATPSDPGECWALANGASAPSGAHLTASNGDGSGVVEFPAHGGGTCSIRVPPTGMDNFHRSDITWRP